MDQSGIESDAKLELISVHVPKCAGMSLLAALRKAYGEEQVYLDNIDRLLDPTAPINTDRVGYLRDFKASRAAVLRGKRVAHGHFFVLKYEGIAALRVTILRDPVDRLLSHYFFWKTMPRHGHALHEQFLAEQPTLATFSRLPGIRWFYADTMFRDVDMRMFDLIGSTEALDATMAKMEKLTGHALPLERHNENTFDAYREQRKEIEADAAVMAGLRDLLREDMAFYEKHVSVR